LSIWVLGREFPDKEDYWDGNWLRAVARAEAPGAQVTVEGPWLRNTEVAKLLERLVALHSTLTGSAELGRLEPQLHVTVECNKLGHVTIAVEITPDHLSQAHRFQFSTDQTFLAPAISGCRRLLQRFPGRDDSPA
jgi:hypothetical protein